VLHKNDEAEWIKETKQDDGSALLELFARKKFKY